VEGPEPHQGGQVAAATSVTQQRPVFTHIHITSVVVRGAKKKFNWGPKNQSVATAFFCSFGYLEEPIKGRGM
jgi:hypothetical protein